MSLMVHTIIMTGDLVMTGKVKKIMIVGTGLMMMTVHGKDKGIRVATVI